jgi:hypothetical protein
MPSMSAGVNPIGFHTHAREFFAAAEAVHASPKILSLPLAFLWGRTIELLLKSYLMSRGVTIKDLRSRKYGHNLVALYSEACDRGLSDQVGIQPSDGGLIQLVNFDYGSKRFEYRDASEPYHLPEPELARRMIRRMIKGIRHHLTKDGT